MTMFSRTVREPAPQSGTRDEGKPIDFAASAWDRLREHLEDERYRLAREIVQYPTPIPACDQDYNHMLAERERLNEAEKRSACTADTQIAIDEFIRSSLWIRPEPVDRLLSR